MGIYESAPKFAEMLGVSSEEIITGLIVFWGHWVFVEVVVSASLMFSVFKGLEWLAPRLYKRFCARRKSKRKG